MANLFHIRCLGCPNICPAVPLTREMFYEIDRENRQLALDLAYLDCIMVYCQFNERYQFFWWPEGELVY